MSNPPIWGTTDLERRRRFDAWYARLTSSIDVLVEAFNHEVGCSGWVAARGDYLCAMRLAFEASGLDCSSFMNGDSMSLKHEVRREGDRLVQFPSDKSGGTFISIRRDRT